MTSWDDNVPLLGGLMSYHVIFPPLNFLSYPGIDQGLYKLDMLLLQNRQNNKCSKMV